MKKRIYSFFLIAFLSFAVSSVVAQDFEMKLIENDMGYLEVQAREITGLVPTSGTNILQITMEIRWLTSLNADVEIICSNNDYNIMDGLSARQTEGNYHWRNFVMDPDASYPHDWSLGVWETIFTLKVTGNPGIGDFEIAPAGWVPQELGWRDALVNPRNITLVGSATFYTFPTLVYDLVWTGADGTYPEFWDVANNWETQCGDPGSIPNVGNNCYVPVVANGNYPTYVGQVAGFGAHQPVCDYLYIASGASITINDKDFGGNQALYTVNNDFQIYGTATIVPDGRLTVSGDTHIEDDQGLVVEASETAGVTSVGSFIDNGNLDYGDLGSANVQIHLYYGTPSSGESFYFHQVGPTVDNESGFSGQYLEDFNLNQYNDYAYTYDESVAPGGQPWVNIWQYTEEIHTCSGMMISTDITEQHTLDMVGELLTGAVTSDPLGHTTGGNHLEMISNPYPSAIDFDIFQGNNSSVIINKNWVWNAAAHNYFARSGGAGGVQFIQVGQAFFVETSAAGSVSFANTDRVHSTDPFRNVMPNILTLDMESAESSIADQLVIRFEEGATTGYDEAIEAIKWNSMNETAAMIRSIAEDGTELSVNVMPELDLQGEMVSVPVQFQTGVAGEYSIIASDLESFESGTEIWLEDKLNGDIWHNFSGGNETYTFTANADDPHDRFIVHFFGPTSINSNEAHSVVIYGANEYAHISNLTKNEVVKEISIYSLAGNVLLNKHVPEQNRYRFFVSNHDGFYIVRVVTDKNIYTEKIFIH
jgi:hypothetical protein